MALVNVTDTSFIVCLHQPGKGLAIDPDPTPCEPEKANAFQVYTWEPFPGVFMCSKTFTSLDSARRSIRQREARRAKGE